ncbi:hypothetical protein C8J57DRAFT_1713202 [Mycena rebaudengoi]|nr:hypothetical protein C8J57DRAFT_1713202 [Mycena rebaudengoi]
MLGTPRVILRGYRFCARWVFRPHTRHYTTAKPAQQRAQDGRFLGVRISTLNPHLIFPSDFLALSHRKTFCVSFTHSRGARVPAPKSHISTPTRVWSRSHRIPAAFSTSDPALSPQAGGIRLRHHRQRHVLFPPQPRHAPALGNAKFRRLREQLLREGMAPKALIPRCRAIFANRRNIHPELTAWGLQHPFLVNLGTSLCLTIVGPAAAHETELQPPTEWIPEIAETRRRELSCPRRLLRTLRAPCACGKTRLPPGILEILEPVACTIQGYAGRMG